MSGGQGDDAAILTALEKELQIAHGGPEARCIERYQGHLEQGSGFTNEARFAHHSFTIDEPAGFGGDDTAANPAEILLGAVGASLAVTLKAHAMLRGIDLGRVKVDVSANLDTRGFFGTDPERHGGFDCIRIEVSAAKASPDQLSDLLEFVGDRCPMLATCERATPVDLRIGAGA